MYTLKQNIQGFTVIDGPMAGRTYKHGIVYQEIPPQEAAKFDLAGDVKEETESKEVE